MFLFDKLPLKDPSLSENRRLLQDVPPLFYAKKENLFFPSYNPR